MNKEDFKIIMSVIPVIMVFLLVSLGISYGIELYTCKDYAKMTQRETKVSNMTCYVKMPTGWYAKNQVRTN